MRRAKRRRERLRSYDNSSACRAVLGRQPQRTQDDFNRRRGGVTSAAARPVVDWAAEKGTILSDVARGYTRGREDREESCDALAGEGTDRIARAAVAQAHGRGFVRLGMVKSVPLRAAEPFSRETAATAR